MDHESSKLPELKLSENIIRIGDVNSLVRELEQVEDFFRQTKIRQPGVGVTLPRISRALEDFTTQNKINLLHEDQLKIAQSYLETIKSRAPIITISFANEPPIDITAKLVRWLRLNIHPEVLIRIGLMPDLVAGCVLRTANKQYDFSLRQLLNSKQQVLKDLITADVEGKDG